MVLCNVETGMRPNFKALRGFSLIELLTVVGIIGILAALILAAIARAKAKAQRIHCANNVRQLGLVLREFVTDNNAYPFLINPRTSRADYPEHSLHWTDSLQQELGYKNPTNAASLFRGIWECPTANKLTEWTTNHDNEQYHCYGYNGFGLRHMTDTNCLGLGGTYCWNYALSPGPPVKESQVASPSEMIAIGDGFIGGNGFIWDGTWILWRCEAMTKDQPPGSTKRSYSRHKGRANVVFCDGHVESPRLQFLFEDASDAALVRWNRDHHPIARIYDT